ncbi:ABC transporter ATP-binding protein [Ruania alba]|uniref:Peptide/nickel transport system ATP-binding protein n=1 Tax=Ruania alba TaxID=648782 RepID=A0A1H5LE34_9MICO|nr:ABC transporter ATP-binding protein [Ruania alba]SEE75254.1 peptide/nickel transport system ATP-binding protein [Ruania alba]
MQQTPTSDQTAARRLDPDAPPVLQLRGLRTEFQLDDGEVQAVDGVDLTIHRGETLAVVGESGCGKSVMARSILQLVDRPGKIVGGQVWVPRPPADEVEATARRSSFFRGRLRRRIKPEVDTGAAPEGMVGMIGADPAVIRAVRGKRIAMVFQEPMTSLSSVHKVGDQIIEAIQLHNPVSNEVARDRAIDLLHRVGIAAPETRVDAYPFELSGGMRQRVMIAMALSCDPELLIADEPTTALDVTTQAQILELLASLRDELGMAIMLITHDLGVAAQLADSVAVMYLGNVVERGEITEIFRSPRHPYTQALLNSIPKLGQGSDVRLAPVRGMVPHPFARPSGCPFHDRCDFFQPGRCDTAAPPLIRDEQGHEVRCVLYEETT